MTAVTAEHPDAPRAWREWEVELGELGGPDLLAAASKLLRKAGATRSSTRSKLVRALGDQAPVTEPRAPRRTKKASAGDVVAGRLAEQLRELRDRDPLVRVGADEGVHKMRVAVRRLRNALASYRPLLDRDVTEPLREELAWLAGSLGAARDAQVVPTELADRLAEESRGLVRGPVARRLEHDARDRRQQARDAVLEALRSRRYAALVDALEALVADPPWQGKAAKPADAVLPRRVRHELRRVATRMDDAERATSAATQDHLLHEARKAVKRARYTAEPVRGRSARRFAKAAEQLQTLLGDHHDTVEAREVLLRLADAAAAADEETFTFGRLHAREEQRADEVLAEVPAGWDRLRRRAENWF